MYLELAFEQNTLSCFRQKRQLRHAKSEYSENRKQIGKVDRKADQRKTGNKIEEKGATIESRLSG